MSVCHQMESIVLSDINKENFVVRSPRPVFLLTLYPVTPQILLWDPWLQLMKSFWAFIPWWWGQNNVWNVGFWFQIGTAGHPVRYLKLQNIHNSIYRAQMCYIMNILVLLPQFLLFFVGSVCSDRNVYSWFLPNTGVTFLWTNPPSGDLTPGNVFSHARRQSLRIVNLWICSM